ncbi:MAG: hypothetical protein MnENMB40S_27730 [Rhizobiaceae bacterium MnEN-MB40S]|nr:MAG: hypothetical protein MnENMB40S_27730 [Rhizobiaceae bacterium MnEN-MB40S]
MTLCDLVKTAKDAIEYFYSFIRLLVSGQCSEAANIGEKDGSLMRIRDRLASFHSGGYRFGQNVFKEPLGEFTLPGEFGCSLQDLSFQIVEQLFACQACDDRPNQPDIIVTETTG